MADRLVATSCSSVCPLSLALTQPNHHRYGCHREQLLPRVLLPASSSTGLLRAQVTLPIPGAAAAAPPRQLRRTGRVTCLFGGEKRDAARKALESALGEKREAFSKWDEEIKKREASGGGGNKGRGRGWGGGGSGGRDDSSEESASGNPWGEAIQVVYAFGGLAALYLVLTKGSSMLAFFLNSVLYVSRGFKSRPTPRYAPATSDDSLDAESHVRNKWGSDD